MVRDLARRLGIVLLLAGLTLAGAGPALSVYTLDEVPDSLLPVGFLLCLPDSAQVTEPSGCDSVTFNGLIRREYRLFMPRGIDDIPTTYNLYTPKPRTEFTQSGSISRGFSFGTGKDLSVQSDFNFEATGKIGKDTEIRAVLSDQRSPVQPEGNTTTISDLDKVYIEAVSKHFSTRLGDIEIDEADVTFFRIDRKVKGIRGDVTFDEAGARAAGAVLEGRKRSQSIQGQEGNNGPYKLEDENGSSSITVIAGTEQVWLDGRLLKRGESADYIIDYNTAEIEFMPILSITGSSRITVDFEYTRQDYQSGLYYGGAYGNLPDIMQLRADFLFQGDQKDNPLGFDISDEDRERLAALGDMADSAYIDGWEEDTAGTYIMIDTLETPYFVFVGDSLGQYSVVFTPRSGGGYEYTDSFYTWVGPDSGTHAPIREVTLPASLSLFSVSATSDSLFPVQFEIEAATSSEDLNTFSPADDGDNTGFAGRLNLAPPKVHTSAGDIMTKYSFIGTDSQFRTPDRIWNADFDREWGFPEGTDAARTVHSLTLATENKPLTAKVLAGLRNDNGGWQGNRIEPSLSLKTGGMDMKLLARNTESRKDTLRGRALLTSFRGTGRVFFLKPTFDFTAERRSIELGDTTEGEQYGSANIDMGFVIGSVEFAPIYEYRMDRRHDLDDYYDYSEATSIGLRMDSKPLDILIRSRDYKALAPDAGTDLKTNSADLGWQFDLFGRKLGIRGDYLATGALSEEKEKVYTYVGAGRGNYSVEPTATDGYIIDPDGDYILEYESTGIFTPTTDMELSTRITISPNWEGRPRLTLSLNTDHSYAGRATDALLPKPSTIMSDTLIRDGSFRTEASLTWRLWKGTLRTGASGRRSANRQFTSGDELRETYTAYTKYDISGGKLRLETSIDMQLSVRDYPGGWRDNSDIMSLTFDERCTWSGLDLLTPSLSAGVKSSQERAGDPYSVISLSIAPEARLTLEKGSIRGELEYTRLNADREIGLIPYEIGAGRYPGDNLDWELSASWRFFPQSITTATLRGEKYADLDPKITMDIKVQYIF